MLKAGRAVARCIDVAREMRAVRANIGAASKKIASINTNTFTKAKTFTNTNTRYKIQRLSQLEELNYLRAVDD